MIVSRFNYHHVIFFASHHFQLQLWFDFDCRRWQAQKVESESLKKKQFGIILSFKFLFLSDQIEKKNFILATSVSIIYLLQA